MALTRKYLTALGIESEKIDEIISAHTETVDGLKEQLRQFEADAKKLPEVQAELDKADDPDDRVALFMKAQQLLAEDAPWMFLYIRENVYMVNSAVVDPASVVAHPIDYYFMTNDWLPAQP